MHSSIRIKRETLKVEGSKIHWFEKVKYAVLFVAEAEAGAIEDVINFIDRYTKVYEMETYKLRIKACERKGEG